MRYLGGKTRIARSLVAAVDRRGLPFWDPFCGSLSVALAFGCGGHCSDISGPLIALYSAVAAGWAPPTDLTKEEWKAAKALPDSDPLKGFAGFGCSFRGCYFSGYAGGYVGPRSNAGAEAAAKVLVRDVRALSARGVTFDCASFFDAEPCPGWLVYLDPPYRDTTPYAGTPPFDHARFYARVEDWAAHGPVYLSEYSSPIGRVVWEHSRAVNMSAGSGARAIEKLYRVG